MRDELHAAVLAGDLGAIERLVASSSRAVRHVAGMVYRPEPEVRSVAARGLGIAARHHPELVANVIRRLIWAMNDESGTNATTAPEALAAIAAERPELVVPVVPDLLRLAVDPGLRDGIAITLRTLSARVPGLVGRQLCEAIQEGLGPSQVGVARRQRAAATPAHKR